MVTTSVNKQRPEVVKALKQRYLLSLLPTLCWGRKERSTAAGREWSSQQSFGRREIEVQPIFLREIYIPGIVVPSSGDMEGVGSLVAMETNGVT